MLGRADGAVKIIKFVLPGVIVDAAECFNPAPSALGLFFNRRHCISLSLCNNYGVDWVVE
jgi:hypothetical protein